MQRAINFEMLGPKYDQTLWTGCAMNCDIW